VFVEREAAQCTHLSNVDKGGFGLRRLLVEQGGGGKEGKGGFGRMEGKGRATRDSGGWSEEQGCLRGRGPRVRLLGWLAVVLSEGDCLTQKYVQFA
jgi:hypothetical protein